MLLARRSRHDSGLRAELLQIAMTCPEPSPDEQRRLAEMWAFRARSEQETAAHYQALAGRLATAGGAPGWVNRVLAAADDERRHRISCDKLAARFGRVAALATPTELPRVAPHGLEGRARLLYEMVAFFCVTESINATLLLRSFKQALDPETRDVLRSLLADEVEHSRIGWAYLSLEPALAREFGDRMPRLLDGTTHDPEFLNEPDAQRASSACAAHGLLSQAELRAVFREAMGDVVLPGLQHCGVDTGAARRWLDDLTARWSV
jgi:hypothetical protein